MIDNKLSEQEQELVAAVWKQLTGTEYGDVSLAYRALIETGWKMAQVANQTPDLLNLAARCKELIELSKNGFNDHQAHMRALANSYHPEISAHDRRNMAVMQTYRESMHFVVEKVK